MHAEFGYELLVCRFAELAWPPEEPDRPVIVSRQLGTKDRRWDTIVVEVDPEAFDARRAFGDRTLDSDLLHIVTNAPEEWAYYRDALPHPGFPWRYVRAAIHRAAARDVIEKRKRNGRIEIRRIRPYPDWIERIVAIENKPDLDASAARALADQLDHDVERGLADEVWVATTATGDDIEPALLEDLPVEVGILATSFDADDADPVGRDGLRSDAVTPDRAHVEWYPSTLSFPDDVDPSTHEHRRLVIGERAYGKGWRSYHETTRPDCRHYQLRRAGDALVPHCEAKGRCPTETGCGSSCSLFSPEPPQWRMKGWPLDGGPGKAIVRLLEDRRARHRSSIETSR